MPLPLITVAVRIDEADDDVTSIVLANSLEEAARLAGTSKLAMQQLGWDEGAGQVVSVLQPENRVIVVGVNNPYDDHDVLSLGRELWKAARFHTFVCIPNNSYLGVVTRALAHGSYDYRARHSQSSDAQATPTQQLTIIVDCDTDATLLHKVLTIEQHVAEVRDLCNHPASLCTPSFFVDHVASLDGGDAAVSRVVINRNEFEGAGLRGLTAVSRGSLNEPAFMQLDYLCEWPNAQRIVLIGKGVTFDTGGTNLKTGESINGLHMDMAGAAIVCGAVLLAARLQLAVNVTAMVSLTDNCIGPAAMMPGDVITYSNGTTVEVRDTDAEGRLLLADLVIRAGKLNPDLVLSVATLTQSVIDGLGDEIACYTTTSDETAAGFDRAATQSNEPFCRFPLYRPYRKGLDSRIADIANISTSKYGDAIMAALFLEEFRSGPPLLHLDIAGKEAEPETPFGAATGFGLWTLVHFLSDLFDYRTQSPLQGTNILKP